MAINDPQDIPNMVADWNAASLSLSQGQNVVNWTDDINGIVFTTTPGSGGTATYDDGTTRSTLKPSVRSVNTRFLASDAALPSTSGTIILIAQVDTDSTEWLFNKTGNDPATMAMRAVAGTGALQAGYRDSGGTYQPTDNDNYRPERVRMYQWAHSGSTFQAWVDGFNFVPEGAANALPTNNGGLALCGHPQVSTSTLDAANVFRFMLWDRALTAQEFADIQEWYLDNFQPRYSQSATALVSSRSSPSAWLDSGTYHVFVCDQANNRYDYYTAPESDPDALVLQQAAAFDPGVATRGCCLVEEAGTWYCFYDERNVGNISYASGASPTTLTFQATLFTGSVGNWYRHPALVPPSASHDGNWQGLVDIRDGSSSTGRTGFLNHISGATPGALVDNGTVISPGGLGWRKSDVGSPSLKRVAGTYYCIAAGYMTPNELDPSSFPHSVGLWTSTNMTAWTEDGDNPLLDSSQDGTRFDCNSAHEPEILEDLTFYYAGFAISPTFTPSTGRATIYVPSEPPVTTAALVMLV